MWEDTVQVFLSLKNTKYNRDHPASAKPIGSDKFALAVLWEKISFSLFVCVTQSN